MDLFSGNKKTSYVKSPDWVIDRMLISDILVILIHGKLKSNNMEPNSRQKHSSRSFSFRRCYALLPMLFFFVYANGQVKKPAVPVKPAPAATTPPATTTAKTNVNADVPVKVTVYASMADYNKSSQGIKRSLLYSKNFQAPPPKICKFDDHSTLTTTVSVTPPASNVQALSKNASGKKTTSSGNGYDCATQQVTMTTNMSDFTVSGDNYANYISHIYPGACYTYANISSGNWAEQAGVRNPITINTNIYNTNGIPTSQLVQNPGQPTIGPAIGKLLSGFKNNIPANEGTTFTVTLGSSASTYNLTIGAGVSGYGVNISNVYSTASQSNHVHLTINAIKPLFNINVSPPDAGFFKDPNVEATPNLTFISNVVYGIRVIADADLTFDSEQDADVFKGSYSGYGINANLAVNFANSNTNTSTNVTGYFVGGPANGVFAASSLGQLLASVNKVFTSASYQTAFPISYTVTTMGGLSLYSQSATDNISVQTCTPTDGGSVQLQNAMLQFNNGGDGKEPGTRYWVRLFTGTNPNLTTDQPMFTYVLSTGNTPYANNSQITVPLTKNPLYKGNFDEESFQKAGGGTLVVGPLDYIPYNTAGIGTDTWQIQSLTLMLYPKATAANGNTSQPLGSGGAGITWGASGGINLVSLSSGTKNRFQGTFSAGFASTGHQ